MKKTIMLIAETCQDGVGRHVSDLVMNLDKKKYNIIVVHGTGRVDQNFRTMQNRMSENVKFLAVPSMVRNIHPIQDMKAFLHVNKLICHYRPTIVHCHSSKAGVIGRLIGSSKSYVKKIIYTPHAYAIQNMQLSSVKHSVYLLIERWLGHKKKVLTINVSNGERQFALDHKLCKENSAVIYNAVEDMPDISVDGITGIRGELKVPENHKLVICAARLYHQKNPQLFCDIAERAAKQHSDVHFIWVGEGEMLEAMRSRVSKMEGLSDRIQFVGYRQDVHPLMCASDIFLSTSRYEGLPYTLIEACRASLPMIAADIVGNSEVVTDGINGHLFNLDEGADAAKELLDELLEDEVLRDKMAQEARNVYEEHFQIQAMVELTEAIYERESL